MKYSIFRPDTGVIRTVLDTNDIEILEANVGVDEDYVEGEFSPDSYIIREGVPAVIPTRPGPWAVWVDGKWTDPRTAADMEAELQERRQAAVLTKLEFLQAAMAIGFLTPADYRQAAMGEIPTPFVPVIESLPPMERDLAEGTWAGSTRVERLDPLILIVAQAANIDDETLDLLFGVEAP